MSKDRPVEKDPIDKLYTVKYVAEMFSVTADTVRNWIRDGHIEGIKVNGYYRVPRTSLMRFAQSKWGGRPAENAS